MMAQHEQLPQGVDGAEPPAVSRRTTVAWAAGAPILLVVVLVLHISLRASADLTPWKGGGFGMFSTVDSPGTRLLRVELRGDSGTFLVGVPERYKQQASEVKAAPSPERLERLATLLAEETWAIPRLPGADGEPRSAEDRALDDLAMQTMAQLLPVDAVKAVSMANYDPATQQLLRVQDVEVSVWRVAADQDERPDGGGTLHPTVLRRVVAHPRAGGSR